MAILEAKRAILEAKMAKIVLHVDFLERSVECARPIAKLESSEYSLGACKNLTRRPSLAGCGGFSALRACHRPLDQAFARIFFNVFGARDADMHFEIFPGRRDLSTVKFSARYDACSSKKRRKTETQKIEKIANFERPFIPRGWLHSA